MTFQDFAEALFDAGVSRQYMVAGKAGAELHAPGARSNQVDAVLQLLDVMSVRYLKTEGAASPVRTTS